MTFTGSRLQEKAQSPLGKGTGAPRAVGWTPGGQVAVNSSAVVEVSVEPLRPLAALSFPDLQHWVEVTVLPQEREG